jgi:hypothetical protein
MLTKNVDIWISFTMPDSWLHSRTGQVVLSRYLPAPAQQQVPFQPLSHPGVPVSKKSAKRERETTGSNQQGNKRTKYFENKI